MFIRRRRPLVRAAIVGGVAYHAGKRAQQGREAEYEQNARLEALEQEQVTAEAPAAPQTDLYDELERLGQLKEKGILTDVEFEAQKQKLLQKS